MTWELNILQLAGAVLQVINAGVLLLLQDVRLEMYAMNQQYFSHRFKETRNVCNESTVFPLIVSKRPASRKRKKV